MRSVENLKHLQDGLHIMVVDDEQHVGMFIEMLLTGKGYSVTRFTSSVEALKQFEKNPAIFDVIITDQNMPGICGTDLAKRLLTVRADIPVILCTGFGYEEIAASGDNTGIAAFLDKPLRSQELLQQIEKYA